MSELIEVRAVPYHVLKEMADRFADVATYNPIDGMHIKETESLTDGQRRALAMKLASSDLHVNIEGLNERLAILRHKRERGIKLLEAMDEVVDQHSTRMWALPMFVVCPVCREKMRPTPEPDDWHADISARKAEREEIVAKLRAANESEQARMDALEDPVPAATRVRTKQKRRKRRKR